MNYDDMSDFEINKLVAIHSKGLHSWLYIEKDRCFTMEYFGDISVESIPDYCSNPADMWPIIVEHKISVHKYFYSDELEWSDNWEASFDKHVNIREGNPEGDLIFHRCKNPLRSAAILFLKIQDYL